MKYSASLPNPAAAPDGNRAGRASAGERPQRWASTIGSVRKRQFFFKGTEWS